MKMFTLNEGHFFTTGRYPIKLQYTFMNIEQIERPSTHFAWHVATLAIDSW